jgi:hypothetical protein
VRSPSESSVSSAMGLMLARNAVTCAVHLAAGAAAARR